MKTNSKHKIKSKNLNPNISITTLNISGLNIPIRTQNLIKLSKKKIQLYAIYKKLISNITSRSKLKNRKGHYKSKESRVVGHINIRKQISEQG